MDALVCIAHRSCRVWSGLRVALRVLPVAEANDLRQSALRPLRDRAYRLQEALGCRQCPYQAPPQPGL